MTPFNIRHALENDIDVVVKFNLALALETEDIRLDAAILREGVRSILSDASKGTYFLAENAGAIVGQAMVTFEWSDWRNANWWWLQSVYVAPSARRHGVFRHLYQDIQKRAADAGAYGLRLYVERENARAQQTYLSLGMKSAPYLMLQTHDE